MVDKTIKYNIIQSIKFLATPSEQQLSLLPNYVCKPDEIAMSLDDWLLLYNNNPVYIDNPLFSPEEFTCIEKLNKMFDSFNSEDWTEYSVSSSKKWEDIRDYANYVLTLLNVTYSLPDLSYI